MTAPFDWAGLWSEATDIRYNHGDPAAADYLRTRIEAAFVPVSAAKALMDEKHKEAAEAKLWFEKAQEWRGELTVATARAEAAEAENARLREAITRLRDCDWVITLPDRMDAVRNIARQALGGEHER